MTETKAAAKATSDFAGTVGNRPLTDGADRVYRINAEEAAAKETERKALRTKQLKERKDSDAVKKAGARLQEAFERGPANGRASGGHHMDQFARRHGNDLLVGHFVDVTDGEHKGSYGVYEDNVAVDEDGYPEIILVSRRDENADLIAVEAEHCVRAQAGKR